MIALAIAVAVPLAIGALLGTIWSFLPKKWRPHIRLPTVRLPTPERKVPHQINMTAGGSVRRVRFTSTESDIKDWDLVHVADYKMVMHHTTIIVGMCVMVVIILASGETAGAIATGALASHDGIALIQEMLNR